MIKLQIIKTENNTDYEQEMKRWEETFGARNRNRDYRDFGLSEQPPELEKTDRILQVVITEKQWEAIKKNVLEVF